MSRNRFIYVVVAFAVVLQFGTRGYIFTLDWIPVLSSNGIMKCLYGFRPPVYGGALVLQLLNLLIPAWVFQRLAIFMVLLLSGISADLLAGRFVKSEISRLYAGLIYMINPFTYVRFLVGHWIILFSYALLPLGIHYFLDMLEENIKSCVRFAFVQTLIGFNAHMFLVSLFIYLTILAVKRKFTRYLIISSFMFFALSSYWILPLLTYHGQTVLSHISFNDLITFAPKGSLFDLMAMYGFWKSGYVYAKDFLGPYWMYLFLLIFGLFLLGFLSDSSKQEYVALMLTWILGFAFASGIKGPFAPVMKFLFENTILKGMRDSQKFVAMLALSYAILGAVGLEWLRKRWKFLTLLFLLVPLLYSFTFFNCFAGQIHPCNYPKDWYTVRTFLDSDKESYRILFFPWHLYMSFHWIKNRNKLIANPAPVFFDKDVISAKNIEIPGVYTEVYTPYQVYVMYLLKNRSNIKNFGRVVSYMGVKYILLTKEVDYKQYLFLFNQSDLKLVLETKNFYVFKNLDYRGMAFMLNGKSVKLKQVSPVDVLVDAPSGLLVYTWQYSKYWRLDGETPFPVKNVVCGFNLNSPCRGEVVYSRFYVVLLSYIISVVSCLVLAYLYYRK